MSNQPLELIQRELERQGGGAPMHVDLPRSVPVAPPTLANASAAVRAGIAAGNINVADTGDRMDFSEETVAAATRTEELLAGFERRKQARNITVPTDDNEVRIMGRETNKITKNNKRGGGREGENKTWQVKATSYLKKEPNTLSVLHSLPLL
jgi:hypothetical protein